MGAAAIRPTGQPLGMLAAVEDAASQPLIALLAACLLVAILWSLGHALRRRFPIFDRIYVPASVIAGTIGLAVVQLAGHNFLPVVVKRFVQQAAQSLQEWPAVLIAVVFAAMLLQRSTKTLRLGVRPIISEAVMVWIIALGQTAIGLWLTWWVIQPFYDVPNAFGMLIETGFAGGHGAAAAMGQVFKTPQLAFPVGLDLGLLMATVGLVYGTISGIFWINVALRTGLAKLAAPPEELGERGLRGDATVANEPTAEGAEARQAAAASAAAPVPAPAFQLRPLARQLVWVLAAFAVGLVVQAAVGGLATWLDARAAMGATAGSIDEPAVADPVLQRMRLVSLVGSFPLFIYTLFGGLLVAQVLIRLGRSEWMDGRSGGQISAVAMDLLVVAAISTLNIEAVAAYLLPILLLILGGAFWSAVCLLVLAPRILPRSHWFELGLINYGMSTGTTATGFVLLRLVDPRLRTDAAKHYALAAPLSAPFVGGGIITIGLPLLVLQRVPLGVSSVVITVVVAMLILVGLRLGRAAAEPAAAP